MKMSDSRKFTQDEFGQWWYLNKDYRARTSPHNCENCGEEFVTYPSRKNARFCSRNCASPMVHYKNVGPSVGKGPLSHRWKGGRRVDERGYVLIWRPDHPNCQGNKRVYVPEHRLVMEEKLGRLLTPSERVHHKNGIKSDNNPENLELWKHGHPAGQRIEEREPMIEIPVSLFLALLIR